MDNNNYQPPQSFPQQQAPQSKYPQLPPINYGVNSYPSHGQVVVNSAMNHGQVGVNPEIAHQKLLLKSDIQDKDSSLSGCFGWTCRIWFAWMIMYGMMMIYYAIPSILKTYRYFQQGYALSAWEMKMLPFLLFGAWLVVQSYLTISNVEKKDAAQGKKLWSSMICLSIGMFVSVFVGLEGPRFNELTFFIFIVFCVIPIIINMIFTVVLKNTLIQRTELVSKLEALSTKMANNA